MNNAFLVFPPIPYIGLPNVISKVEPLYKINIRILYKNKIIMKKNNNNLYRNQEPNSIAKNEFILNNKNFPATTFNKNYKIKKLVVNCIPSLQLKMLKYDNDDEDAEKYFFKQFGKKNGVNLEILPRKQLKLRKIVGKQASSLDFYHYHSKNWFILIKIF